MDKELLILENIQNNNEISQRQLSDTLGISLGSVNTLLKKMKREGLIKVKEIPANRVAYMLTPKGIVEKASKTYVYVKNHYKYISEKKKIIEQYLLGKMEDEEIIYILISDEDIFEIFQMVLNEIKQDKFVLAKSDDNIYIDAGALILVDDEEYYNKYLNYRIEKVMNIF